MSQVVSFAEESCWDGEEFRQVRKKVVFRVYSVGKNLGVKVDAEFISDYSLWYLQEDDYLIAVLRQIDPRVNWDHLVYHRKLDMSGIDVYESEHDRLAVRIEVRGSHKGRVKLTEEDLGPTVIRLGDIPARLEQIRAEEEERLCRKREKRRLAAEKLRNSPD